MEIVFAGDRIGSVAHRRRQPAVRGPDRRRGGSERIAPIDVAADHVQPGLETFEQRAQKAERVFRCGERRERTLGSADPHSVPPPIARDFTTAGSLSIVFASLGSSAERLPRSWIAGFERCDLRRRAGPSPNGSSRSPLGAVDGSSASRRRLLFAFHAAPMPMSTGNARTIPDAITTGRNENVARRTTPELRSARIIV